MNTLKPIYRRRLRKLAAYLRTVPEVNFDIHTVTRGVASTPDGWLSAMQRHACGTAGCAVGYSPVVFPRLLQYDDIGCVRRADGKRVPSVAHLGKVIFGVGKVTANWLFFADMYVRPDASCVAMGGVRPAWVADRLEYVAKHGKFHPQRTYGVPAK